MEKSQLKISNLIQRNIKAWRGKATRGAAGLGVAWQKENLESVARRCVAVRSIAPRGTARKARRGWA
jgi:hypothetical protein